MQKGRVTSRTGLNLRLKPNGNKVGVLSYDEKFTIVEELTFFRVKSANGQVGYVHGDYVEKIPTQSIVASETSEAGFTNQFKPVFLPMNALLVKLCELIRTLSLTY